MLRPFEVRRYRAGTPLFPDGSTHPGVLQGKETEHNWAPREQAIQRVRGMLKGEVHARFHDTFLLGLKNGFITASLKTASVVRTDTTC